MKDKLITFVVPCFNSEDYMERCIDSLLPAGEAAEILIVNDGSTDNTGEIARCYAERYPAICRVLEQENGGHGEGINHGLAEASGEYFKVVDSDDWLDGDALKKVMALLESLEDEGGVDLIICNYIYDHQGNDRDRVIGYKNCFPSDRIFSWEEIGVLLPWQYLTLHSCIHRTEVLREGNVVLPKHTFYEDNLFVYLSLPHIGRMYYIRECLYHYLIGREGQSVAEEVLKERCSHQILVSSMVFKAYRLEDYRKDRPKLVKYMRHEIVFMLAIATIFTRLNKTEEAECEVRAMWDDLSAHDKRMAAKLKRSPMAGSVNLPGKAGRGIGLLLYRAAHKFTAFN